MTSRTSPRWVGVWTAEGVQAAPSHLLAKVLGQAARWGHSGSLRLWEIDHVTQNWCQNGAQIRRVRCKRKADLGLSLSVSSLNSPVA